jgi:hypothetical protein
MAESGTPWQGAGNCLAHTLYDVLRGHCVADPLRHVTSPIGLVFEVDRYLRPWLISPGEQWFDRPRFFHGLRAQWRAAHDVAGLGALAAELVASGRVPILRSYEWRLPWMRRPGLPVLNPHVLVAVEWNDEQIVVIDRLMLDASGQVEEQTMSQDDLGASIGRGIAVLDYSLDPDRRAGGTDAVFAESIRHLRGFGGPIPLGTDYGVNAIRLLARIVSVEHYPALDSVMLRLWLRVHTPDNIRLYIVGGRRIFQDYLAAEAGDGYRDIARALKRTCREWCRVADELAASGAAGDGRWAVDWAPVIEAELELAARLQEALDARRPVRPGPGALGS